MSTSMVTAGKQASETPLYCLAYVSKMTPSNDSNVHTIVSDISHKSKKNNKIAQISGVFCYFEEHFFQYAEGSKEALLRLKSKIENDDRHFDIYYLDFSAINKPHFVTWQMRYYSLEYLIENSKNSCSSSVLDSVERMKTDDLVWRNFIEELLSLEEMNNNKKRRIIILSCILFILVALVFFMDFYSNQVVYRILKL